MSGFSPEFDAAGAGTRDGSVPAPGAIDGMANFLRADRSWAVPGSQPPGPQPPAPGPDLNQWACNVAGFLTYTVVRALTKRAIDWLPTSWIGDVVGGIVTGLIDVLLPEAAMLDESINAIVFHWVSTYVNAHLADFAANIIDDVLWAKIHCRLYSAIVALPGDLATAVDAAATAIAALTGYPTGVLLGLEYLLQHMGIDSVVGMPLSAFSRQYDCSTCATTGVGPVAPLLQSAFDLTVTDGTNSAAFVSTLQFNQSAVSGTGPTATITPEVTAQHDGTSVATRPVINFADTGSVTATVTDDPPNNRVTVALTATVNPMTTKGDLIVGATGGTPARLPVGSANTFLQAVPAATDGLQYVLLQGSDIPNLDTSKLTTGQVSAARGGTGIDTSAVSDGDLLVGTSSHTWVRGGIGGGNGITVSELGGIFTVASNITAGTNISITVVGGAVRISATGGGGLYSAYVCIQDQKAQNTQGGSFISGAWRTRDLNTIVADTGSNASISSSQITLAAGTYRCEITCPGFQVFAHQARLQNITDSTTLLLGTSEYNANALGGTSGSTTSSRIVGRFTLAASKVLEVQHRCSSSSGTNGFGQCANLATEIYSCVEFFKE